MQLQSPAEWQANAMQMRSMQQQVQKGELEQQAMERAAQEEQALRSLFGAGQPIREQDMFRIVGPVRGAAIMKGLADLKTAQIKNEGDLRMVVGSALGAIKALPEPLRDAGYQAVRQSFLQKGWVQPSDVPEQYSPEVLEQFQQWALTPEQQVVDADRVADNARLDADQADKRPGVMADNTRKGSEALDAQLVTEGRLLGAATNTAEWQAALAQLPPERVKQYAPIYSPGQKAFIVKAAQTAQERIDNAIKQQNANTSSASQAETARHNKFMREREKTGSYQWALDPRDGKVRLMSPDEIRKVDAGQAPTADMRNKESARPAVQRGITAIRELGKDIFTKVGPAQRAEAIKRGAEAVFGNDPVFRTYQDARMATAGALAVEQQGARVSDADVKALWLPMVPDAYRDTKESNDLKWELIDALRGANAPKAAPPAVSDALKSLGAGRHTLSNGEVWEKDAAGNLRKVQ